MPIVFESPYASIGEGIQKAGSALGSALGDLAERSREQFKKQEHRTILDETLGGLSLESTPTEIAQAYTTSIKRGVPSETVKDIFAPYQELLKQKIKTAADIDLLGSLGLVPTPQASGIETGEPTSLQPSEKPSPLAQKPIDQWSEDELVLAQASGIQPLQKMADAQLKKIELEDKRAVEERRYRTEGGKEVEKKISGLRESMPKKKFALTMARNAVESGEVGAFSMANLAKRMGIPELQTTSGAQLITAGKENLFSNMSRVSAKAQNMWFEQRMSSMFPKIGESQEANLTTAEMLEAENAMDEAYLQEYDRISAADEEKLGYVDYRTIEKRARKETEPIDKEIFDRSMFRLRQLYEQEKGAQWLIDNVMKKVPQGTPLTPKMASAFLYKYKGDKKKVIQNAKKLGYILPTKGDIERWE